jgi:hypothetical protein
LEVQYDETAFGAENDGKTLLSCYISKGGGRIKGLREPIVQLEETHSRWRWRQPFFIHWRKKNLMGLMLNCWRLGNIADVSITAKAQKCSII